ncbi:hypothetical protein VSF3289_03204 [Vibrio scophthalmi]|uniref:Uncharacterized protein n=1 Tax=Vibrio scophthalmi TaxID=45658 RepID=A0A1E3WL80_9VIBR|nr:hypothetical protein VSF3289_03204 [Vibrio scophthalmi]
MRSKERSFGCKKNQIDRSYSNIFSFWTYYPETYETKLMKQTIQFSGSQRTQVAVKNPANAETSLINSSSKNDQLDRLRRICAFGGLR